MKCKTIYALSVFWGVQMVFSLAALAADNKEKPLFDYQRSQLKNGLTVITLEDFSCPIVAVQVWYQVGSKDERADRQGYAHMFEHMMFKGTENVGPKDHFQLIQKTGGTTNAYTSFDQTVYVETLPASQLALPLWLEAERMAFLKIDQESFDTERKVVEEELRKGENEPYGTLYKKLAAIVFKDQPYRWTPIGNIACLRATSVADLRAFWQQYYVPNNATLILVGAIRHDKAVQMAETYFGWIQKRPEPPRVQVHASKPDAPQIVVIDDENAPAAVAGYIFRTVPMGHTDQIALDFLSSILGGTQNSRLYRDLVADSQTATHCASMTWNLQQDGIFAVGAVQAPGADAKTVLQQIKKHIETIQKEGVTDTELQTARNQQLRSVITDNLNIESKAQVLGTAAVTIGDLEYANSLLGRIRAVRAIDIQRVANTYLRFDQGFEISVKQNLSGMLNASKDDETQGVIAEREKQAPPAGRPGEKRPETWPTTAPIAKSENVDLSMVYSEHRLKNGIKVIVVPNHEVPFISVKLGCMAGAATEIKPGTANLALQMLERGTTTRSEKQLAEELSLYAISLGGTADMDTCQVNMSCLTEHLDKGMDLLADVVRNASFEATEFEKLRKQTLTSLLVNEKTPEYLADKEFSFRLFGNHPYARTVEGNSADIEKLTVDDLKQWWKQYVRPEDSVLIFSGDIDAPKALVLAETRLGEWTCDTARPEVKLAAIPQQEKTHIWLVDNPGSAQVQLRVGCHSINRKDQPDYFISRVVGNYFGGSFHSRINETLRVQKGLTYGAFGSYTAQKEAGYFVVNTFTKNETAGQAIAAIIELLDQLRKDGPTAEELELSRSYISGSILRRRETPQQIANDLWLIEAESLGRDYYDKLLAGVNAADEAKCLALANKTINPDQLTIVVVGDAEKIKADLEKIAPVTVVARDPS
ncbi:M16 family metallopeptidase [Anaerohalosphaeraceae bacterium U12dextr]